MTNSSEQHTVSTAPILFAALEPHQYHCTTALSSSTDAPII